MTKIKKKCSKASVQNGNSVVTLESEKVKKKRSHRKLRFCELPREILEHILSNIDTFRWNGIRATCKHLKDICDTSLIREFKTNVKKYKQQDKNGYEFVTLNVIHQLTWRYIKSGYCPLFLGQMLSFIRIDLSVRYLIKQYLLKFYKIVEECSGDACSQTARLLYVSTLLGLLNNCKNAAPVTSTDDCSHNCQLIYRLDGPWLWKRYPDKSSINRNELLVILAEIMILAELEGSFMKTWQSENAVYLFGYSSSPNCTAKTFLTFNIYGSPKILSLLKNVTSEENWDYLPKDEFSLNLRIFSEKSNKSRLSGDYQLEIGPYSVDEY